MTTGDGGQAATAVVVVGAVVGPRRRYHWWTSQVRPGAGEPTHGGYRRLLVVWYVVATVALVTTVHLTRDATNVSEDELVEATEVAVALIGPEGLDERRLSALVGAEIGEDVLAGQVGPEGEADEFYDVGLGVAYLGGIEDGSPVVCVQVLARSALVSRGRCDV